MTKLLGVDPWKISVTESVSQFCLELVSIGVGSLAALAAIRSSLNTHVLSHWKAMQPRVVALLERFRDDILFVGALPRAEPRFPLRMDSLARFTRSTIRKTTLVVVASAKSIKPHFHQLHSHRSHDG